MKTFNDYFILNENNSFPLFKLGDIVIVNDNIKENNLKYGKSSQEKIMRTIRKTGQIIFVHSIIRNGCIVYDVYVEDVETAFTIDEPSLTLKNAKPSRIRWYSKGTFTDDEKTYELFRGMSITNSLLKELRRNRDGDSAFFISDLKKIGGNILDVLNEMLIGKRVLFYYDLKVDDISKTYKEIMTIKKVQYLPFDYAKFKKPIVFEGVPEKGVSIVAVLNEEYPITILKEDDKKRRFTEHDPFGEEEWD